MGDTTNIEWADATFNPWIGCARVSRACQHCYAERLGHRFGVEWGKTAERKVTSDGYWRRPLAWNRQAQAAGVPKRVFCASLADVFEDRDDLVEHRTRLWDVVDATPWLVWLLLTKRPEHVLDAVPDLWPYGEWPANVWVGTTAESQAEADRRLPALMQVPAPVRFVSVEPMVGAVDLRQYLADPDATGEGWAYQCQDHGMPECRQTPACAGLQWVICGGETGPGAEPMHPQWARQLRDQVDAAGVPFMFKQWGDWAPATEVRQHVQLGRLAASTHNTHQGGGTPRQLLDTAGHTHSRNDLPGFTLPDGWVEMAKVGKKTAGRVLDGRTWDGCPPLPMPVAP